LTRTKNREAIHILGSGEWRRRRSTAATTRTGQTSGRLTLARQEQQQQDEDKDGVDLPAQDQRREDRRRKTRKTHAPDATYVQE